MSDSALTRANTFLADFARAGAGEVVDVPGGFAALNERYPHSRADNQLVVEGDPSPEALLRTAETALGHLPYRRLCVLREETADACREALLHAGYAHEPLLVMRHTGASPAPRGRRAETVDLDSLREPVAAFLRELLPAGTDEQVVRDLVERRAARESAAPAVEFLASRAESGEPAAWADLYLDPARGVAQLEDLVTHPAHRRQGHADAVLATALHRASEAGCGLRFLLADESDWPRHWYRRRDFTVIGRSHTFERIDDTASEAPATPDTERNSHAERGPDAERTSDTERGPDAERGPGSAVRERR
ncbi:GNAT family N-acetyltransferase [Streptomyces sp. XM4193]|uniref:GNAT family N-acetyltransferase n=1 Tax=Streptomyces sp. XM4193 TaxID=2929782 RepID=UPI001FFA21EF|nr:GNAT family N-acetyltransferase [Streptomyces sp. XM4193]MCK1796679.1 GNAT family N-acetyltransferase [Streptomyces sp. XM4193]